MILDDLADYLTTGGIATQGTDLFIGDRIPDTPSQLIFLRLTDGPPSVQSFGQSVGGAAIDQPRIQVDVRSTTYPLADTLLRSVRNAFDRLGNVTINSTFYHSILALQGEPIPLGVDEQRRHMLVMNFQVRKERS